MLRLEDITKDAAVNGIEPGQVVRIVTTEPIGENALTVYYRTADGRVPSRRPGGRGRSTRPARSSNLPPRPTGSISPTSLTR